MSSRSWFSWPEKLFETHTHTPTHISPSSTHLHLGLVYTWIMESIWMDWCEFPIANYIVNFILLPPPIFFPCANCRQISIIIYLFNLSHMIVLKETNVNVLILFWVLFILSFKCITFSFCKKKHKNKKMRLILPYN